MIIKVDITHGRRHSNTLNVDHCVKLRLMEEEEADIKC